MTTTIPIVFLAGDPVSTGLVTTLARPGGNVTGLAMLTAELGGKRLELLREIIPSLRQVGVITHATDPFARPFLGMLQTSAPRLGVQIKPVVTVRNAAECDDAMAVMKRERTTVAFVQAVLVQSNETARHVAACALRHRVAEIAERYFTEAGGLLSYAADPVDARRQSAAFVDKILKGAKPAELPVEQPTKVEFVVNLKTAKALGITIPKPILIRADHIIE